MSSNFSSDIDIIYFYESARGETSGLENDAGDRRGVVSLHVFFNKLGEMISKALSQVTGDGFVFRVDVGLRPEGKSGDMAISVRSAEIYYESWGQSWERTAMLKARPIAGSLELGNRLLKILQPFVYRKYLDYNLIEDMKNMKQKIDASLARTMEGEANLKLGRGGNTRDPVFRPGPAIAVPCKNPSLRERNSLKALDALLAARLISDDDHGKLSEAYRFLRTVEHRIQVVQERQTHNLPAKKEELQALARRCGFLRPNGQERFLETLEEHRTNVSAIYGNLFYSPTMFSLVALCGGRSWPRLYGQVQHAIGLRCLHDADDVVELRDVAADDRHPVAEMRQRGRVRVDVHANDGVAARDQHRNDPDADALVDATGDPGGQVDLCHTTYILTDMTQLVDPRCQG